MSEVWPRAGDEILGRLNRVDPGTRLRPFFFPVIFLYHNAKKMQTRSKTVRKRAPRNSQAKCQTPPLSPRKPKATIPTPTRTRVLDKVQELGGSVPKEQIFEKCGVSDRSGYRILQSHQTRRSGKAKNSGRHAAMYLHQAQAVKVVEDSSFKFAAMKHQDVAKWIGVDNNKSERAIQRDMSNMVNQKTRVAAQAHSLTRENKDERITFCDEHWDMTKEELHNMEFSDEVDFSLGPQKRQRIHRAPTKKARELPQKIQKRYSRKKQCYKLFGSMNWEEGLSQPYLCKGSGRKGKMVQKDYAKLLEEHLADRLKPNSILLEDNDRSHGTLALETSHIKKTKTKLKINCRANPRNSPDLNPIERIWRCIKQRLKQHPPPQSERQLWRNIIFEWNRITIDECRRYIEELPSRMRDVIDNDGDIIP